MLLFDLKWQFWSDLSKSEVCNIGGVKNKIDTCSELRMILQFCGLNSVPRINRGCFQHPPNFRHLWGSSHVHKIKFKHKRQLLWLYFTNVTGSIPEFIVKLEYALKIGCRVENLHIPVMFFRQFSGDKVINVLKVKKKKHYCRYFMFFFAFFSTQKEILHYWILNCVKSKWCHSSSWFLIV